MSHTHDEAQSEELAFWQTPGAELGEQLKQLTYAKFMKLDFVHDGNSPYVIHKEGKKIADIGGGPISLLLKTIADRRVVVDPCQFDVWVGQRYIQNGVVWQHISGEAFHGEPGNLFDEIWMYNVLQHTIDPDKIFNNIYESLASGGVFRFVDWVNTAVNVAHPISLSYESLCEKIADYYDQPLLKTNINENGAVGTIVYGVFSK